MRMLLAGTAHSMVARRHPHDVLLLMYVERLTLRRVK